MTQANTIIMSEQMYRLLTSDLLTARLPWMTAAVQARCPTLTRLLAFQLASAAPRA